MGSSWILPRRESVPARASQTTHASWVTPANSRIFLSDSSSSRPGSGCVSESANTYRDR
jgi:hypothetical protein